MSHENEPCMFIDFEKLKSFPHKNLVHDYMMAICIKWENHYGEKVLVEKWMSEVSGDFLSRVEINKKIPYKCGFPCDNNIVESNNNVDKKYFDRWLNNSQLFMNNLAGLCREGPRNDLCFLGTPKNVVHSIKFYTQVLDICTHFACD